MKLLAMTPKLLNLNAIRSSDVLLTCEHASNKLPEGYKWGKNSIEIENQHWAIDLGASELTEGLSKDLNAAAILCTVSRLFIDVNRPLSSTTLFRNAADGKDISFNLPNVLTEEEKQMRIDMVYKPYHSKLSELISNWKDDDGLKKIALSIHSFTDNYEGNKRTLEIGVLYENEENSGLARKLCDYLKTEKFNTELNQPWSGKEGFMYSVSSACQGSKIQPLMIEARQDLLTNAEWRQRLQNSLVTFFKSDLAQQLKQQKRKLSSCNDCLYW